MALGTPGLVLEYSERRKKKKATPLLEQPITKFALAMLVWDCALPNLLSLEPGERARRDPVAAPARDDPPVVAGQGWRGRGQDGGQDGQELLRHHHRHHVDLSLLLDPYSALYYEMLIIDCLILQLQEDFDFA